MNTILKVIAADRPGTTAISLPLFEGEVDSLVPLAEQAKTVAETIRKTIAANASLYVVYIYIYISHCVVDEP